MTQQISFLVPAYPGCPGKEAVKWVYVCQKAYMAYNFNCHIKTEDFFRSQADTYTGTVKVELSLKQHKTDALLLQTTNRK